jgi:hypothetical protein
MAAPDACTKARAARTLGEAEGETARKARTRPDGRTGAALAPGKAGRRRALNAPEPKFSGTAWKAAPATPADAAWPPAEEAGRESAAAAAALAEGPMLERRRAAPAAQAEAFLRRETKPFVSIILSKKRSASRL